MADLSTLDPTQPPDTQAVSQGAARIRETRDSTINSFGIEHALTGPHKFLSGTQAARPAAGNSGRLYINTDHTELELDSGAAWAALHALNPQVSTLGTLLLTGTFTNVGTGIVLNCSANSNIIAFAMLNIASAAGNVSVTAEMRILLDGTTTLTGSDVAINTPVLVDATAFTVPITICGTGSVSAEGTHLLAVQAKANAGTGTALGKVFIAITA